MTSTAATTSRFRVYARHMDPHHARFVDEISFEAAAVAFLENFDVPGPMEGALACQVIVQEVGTGHEHCFTLDLETGDATPCG